MPSFQMRYVIILCDQCESSDSNNCVMCYVSIIKPAVMRVGKRKKSTPRMPTAVRKHIYRRIYKSIHSIRHSLCPSKSLNQPSPRPVHSGRILPGAYLSAAARTSPFAVELSIYSIVSLTPSAVAADNDDALLYKAAVSLGKAPIVSIVEVVDGRGRNQLLLKSKKHRSDQLQLVRKRMMRRMLQ